MDDINVHIIIQGCAKAFITNCDKDADTYITEQEWGFCLGANTHCKLVLSSIVSLHIIDTPSKISSQLSAPILSSVNFFHEYDLEDCKGCDCIVL